MLSGVAVFHIGQLVYLRWPNAGGERVVALIIDVREPNLEMGRSPAGDLGAYTGLEHPDYQREWLIQIGSQTIWVRGWSIVPHNSVIWRKHLVSGGDDENE